MILSTYTEENTEIIFSYRPAWEMFFALHVLAAPEHHGMQREWVQQIEKEHPELINEIRSLKDTTDNWNFVIDSDWWLLNREKTVPEILDSLKKLNIDRWNEYFICARGESIV